MGYNIFKESALSKMSYATNVATSYVQSYSISPRSNYVAFQKTVQGDYICK